MNTTTLFPSSPPRRLKVDGIALGDQRNQVERRLKLRRHGASPAWARYATPVEHADTLVCYQPAWPSLELESWRVHTICGSTLFQGDQLLIMLGDDLNAVKAALGEADAEFTAEPGYRSLRFGSCLVVLDMNWRVAEISLSAVGQMSKPISGETATPLLDGTLAC